MGSRRRADRKDIKKKRIEYLARQGLINRDATPTFIAMIADRLRRELEQCN